MISYLPEIMVFNKSIIDPIARKYKVGQRLKDNFHYVSLNMSQDKSNAIQVNQNEYAAEMQEILVSISRKSDRTSSQE